jgi:ornithine cyclodeaminase/alanine dehydrogenase-like protein (mu-crystallin family)
LNTIALTSLGFAAFRQELSVIAFTSLGFAAFDFSVLDFAILRYNSDTWKHHRKMTTLKDSKNEFRHMEAHTEDEDSKITTLNYFCLGKTRQRCKNTIILRLLSKLLGQQMR